MVDVLNKNFTWVLLSLNVLSDKESHGINFKCPRRNFVSLYNFNLYTDHQKNS